LHSQKFSHQPGASFSAYSSTEWSLLEAALVELELRAAAAAATLATAAANNVGLLIGYKNLVLLNEAASDLGFIADQLKATVSRLQNETMAAWKKRAVSSYTTVNPLISTAKQNGQLLSQQNPTFYVGQLP